MEETFTGILTTEKNKAFLKGPSGQDYLKDEHIWEGYITHWKGQTVHA